MNEREERIRQLIPPELQEPLAPPSLFYQSTTKTSYTGPAPAADSSSTTRAASQQQQQQRTQTRPTTRSAKAGQKPAAAEMLTQTQRAHKAACSPGFSAAEARLRERTAEIERQTLARLEHASRPMRTTHGATSLDQPDATTTRLHHRTIPTEEQDGYGRKDVATYWSCEDYPAVRGHGPKTKVFDKKEATQKMRPPVPLGSTAPRNFKTR